MRRPRRPALHRHRPEFRPQLGGNRSEPRYWNSVNAQQLNSMFMQGPNERARTRGATFKYVGAAWAVSPTGVAYLVEEFG